MSRPSAPLRSGWMLSLLALLLLVFVAWAAYFRIDQTVRARGQFIVGPRTQVIQALDGGLLTDIRVKEGQRVQQGEVLAVLEKDRSAAAVDEIRAKLAGQEAALARLLAEAEHRSPQFPPSLKTQWPLLVQVQQHLFEQKLSALKAEVGSIDLALALARDELALHERLFRMGDVARLEVMRAERQVIELDNRRRALIDKYRSEARAEHAAIAQDRSTLSFRLDERRSVLKHTVITAPMAGVVKYVRITTEGGVLRQGDELMQISPVDEDFLVEIKVDPADVGQVKLGQSVAVQLDAFDRSIYGTLPGELVYVSSDTLVEQGNGQVPTQVYYRAHVALRWSTTQPVLLIRPTDLKSGMTAIVDIRTGERSVLTYLLKPIQKSFRGALSER